MTATLTCAHCGGGLGRDDRFCAQCGAELLSCRTCGESLLPSDLSCPECGTPAEPAALPESLSLPSADSQALWTDMVDRLQRATLGEFEIGRELGRGGMAAVFLAHEISLARKVAIKVMSPGLLLDDGMIDRFRHEAITIAHLHHPHIVSLYSVRQAEGLHFFVMQYVQGRSLDQIIELGGKLPVPTVRSILAQVGSALAYAHRSRVVHRDIKPANILIDGEGNAVVTDFGIAKAAATPSQTLTGALVGTPAYMSPEQCRGTEVSGASDQYSLGAVAYEMLTGAPPFGGSTLTVMQAHVEQSPQPIRELSGECPPELETAILRMLEKDPAARWPRMADAVLALGAKLLAEDDPLRVELGRLTHALGPILPVADQTPTSPTPRTRPPGGLQAVSDVRVSDVSVLPPPAGLEVGDSFVLVATVRGERGVVLPSTTVAWSGDAPDVLRVASTGGEAVAVGAGSALLTATCDGVEGMLRVEVATPRADEIVIAPPDHAVAMGDEIRLEAVARDKRGRPIDRPVTWGSDDSAAATITAEGELVGRSPGFARITAALDNARAGVIIPVLPARVAAIHLAEGPVTVAADTSFDIGATPVDRWGSPLRGRRVRWTSSDAGVAVTTADGRMRALHPGSAVLTASCEGVNESVRVSVGDPPLEPPRVKHRRVRRHRREQFLGTAVVVALVAGGIWVVNRTRLARSEADTAQALSPSFGEPTGGGPATAETAAAPSGALVDRPIVVRRRRSMPADSVGGNTAAGPAAAGQSAPLGSADQSGSPASGNPASLAGSGRGVVPGTSDTVPGGAAAVDTFGPAWSGKNVETGGDATLVSSGEAMEVVETVPQPAGPVDATHERQKLEARMLAGAEQCYAALKSKDIDRLSELYRPATPSDRDKLKKLSRLFRTREWSAAVGARVDGNRQLGLDAAAMEFTVRLTWNDAFGGHLSSQPVFRTEFVRRGDRWEMSSCRIVGSPKL